MGGMLWPMGFLVFKPVFLFRSINFVFVTLSFECESVVLSVNEMLLYMVSIAISVLNI